MEVMGWAMACFKEIVEQPGVKDLFSLFIAKALPDEFLDPYQDKYAIQIDEAMRRFAYARRPAVSRRPS